jgi:hypothetical protein
MTSVSGDSVVDTVAGIGVSVSDNAARGASEEGAAGEQPARIRVRKRIARINLFISA